MICQADGARPGAVGWAAVHGCQSKVDHWWQWKQEWFFKLRLELKYILNVDILYSRSDLLLYVVTIAVMEDDI